ncbi:MAG: prepilin-type N-terminal cleavage/methylation domain-containing protein [Planctomycetota bacterium]
MRKRDIKKGFSLTEVMMAVGILAVALVFIAGTFPVGVSLTAVATERTIAAVVSDEAFAKIRIYGVDMNPGDPNHPFNNGGCAVFDVNMTPGRFFDSNEYEYPSTYLAGPEEKKYTWAALCRLAEPGDPASRLVQMTVFISRISGAWGRYPRDANDSFGGLMPVPVRIEVQTVAGDDKRVEVLNNKQRLVHEGSTIVEDSTGEIYRVVGRDSWADEQLLLDRVWQGGANGYIWVIPSAISGGRYPCVGVYQKVVRF